VRVASYEKPDVTLDVYGWTQPRFTYEVDDARPVFSLPQTRLGLIGGFGKWGWVQTEINLGTIDTSMRFSPPELLDAYGVFTPYRSRVVGIDVTFGKFRVPFSRQGLIQPVGLQLPDTASFVKPAWTGGRPLGAMLGVDFWDRKIRLTAGAFSVIAFSEEPLLLYAGRLEIQPLGPAPRFEGDVRAVGLRRRPALSIGASAMKSRNDLPKPVPGQEPGTFDKIALGADLGVWYAGASLYGELLFAEDRSVQTPSSVTRSLGLNVQAGYFPPLPFMREHVEIVGRVERLESRTERPLSAPQIRETTTLTWSAGLNFFVDRGHLLKMQIFYQGDQYTDDRDDTLILQATAGF